MSSDYSIPIVQGTAVPAPGNQQYNRTSYEPTATSVGVYHTQEGANFSNYGQPQQHQQQPNQFRDVIWAVAFVLHLGAMLFVISANIANGDGGGDGAGSYTGIYALVGIAVVASIGISSAAIVLMMRYPEAMVKAGLVFSAILVGAMSLMFVLSGSLAAALMGLFFFGITVCYLTRVWSRIPFAAGEYYNALFAEIKYCCCRLG
jgi:hypothetical protein